MASPYKIERKLAPDRYDAATLEKMREWPKDSAAVMLDSRVRTIEKDSKLTFIELGLILKEVDTRELWKHMNEKWHSFDAWLSDAAPVCRTSGYSALKAIRELGDVPVEELEEMPRCNVGLLAKVPKARREPEVIKAAQTLSEEAFTGYVERKVPEAHIESKSLMRFKPERSQRAKIDEALALAGRLEETESREEQLEILAAEYLENHREEITDEPDEPSAVSTLSSADAI